MKYKTREDKIGDIRPNKKGTLMKLIAYRHSLDCDIEFQDEYKFIFEHAIYQNFLKGQIKNPYDKTVFDVGMLGVGKYMARNTGDEQMSREYCAWKHLLARCYAHASKYPAYFNITTVCDEWLIFQNFAKWHEESIYDLPNDERVEIDKDIINPSSKCYSPENCVYVPQSINLIFTYKAKDDGLPTGITRTVNGKRFQAMYNAKSLGTHDTLEEAYNVYAKAKEKAIKQIADKYRQYIPKKLYDALYAYEVKMENDKNYNRCEDTCDKLIRVSRFSSK